MWTDLAVRRPRLFYGIVAGVACVALALVVLAAIDWNRFKGPLERAGSARLHRTVAIDGRLAVHPWSWTPQVSLDGLRIGGPPWDPDHDLLHIAHMSLRVELRRLFTGHLVLRRVEIEQPELYLHEERSGRANWTLENQAPSEAHAPLPPKLPALRELVIRDGKIEVIDDLRHLHATGTIAAQEGASGPADQAFQLHARGTLNAQPFRLQITGGELINVDPAHPYPFRLGVVAGGNSLQAEGRVEKPFDLGQLDLDMHASGHDLAELFYLTQLALPNSPPYDVRAHVHRDGQSIAIRRVAGRLGGSDIHGSVDVDASRKRPFVKAALKSDHLYLADLAAVTGSKASPVPSLDEPAPSTAPTSGAKPVPPSARFFPDARLQIDRIRAMDAKLDFSASSVEAGSLPITHLSLQADLKDGLLKIDPLAMTLPQGRLQSAVSLDARQSPPEVAADARLTDVKLDQLKGSSPGTVAPLDGILQARAQIAGHGDSVHRVMASADGSLTAVVPHGDVRAALAELTGVDVVEGVGLLMTKPDEQSPVRCGVARFAVEDGRARAQTIVFDTRNVLVTGRGQIDLGTEALDLTVQGEPKKPRLLRLRAPIKVQGTMRSPSFHLEQGHLLKQGGIAAALAAFLSPLAAVLAFVDPGLAKDQDCQALVAEADASSNLDTIVETPAPQTPARPPEPGRAPTAKH